MLRASFPVLARALAIFAPALRSQRSSKKSTAWNWCGYGWPISGPILSNKTRIVIANRLANRNARQISNQIANCIGKRIAKRNRKQNRKNRKQNSKKNSQFSIYI